ncbi:MAG: transposase [Anaerolineales bacterium]|nr:transposase [Anaerolineales bacterium]
MKYDPLIHHRRSIRLKNYDYRQAGAYFVTFCVQNREHLLGEIIEGEMHLSDYGRIVTETWLWLAENYSWIVLDVSVVMPNHFHGILVINDEGRRGGSPAPSPQAQARTAPTSNHKPLGRLVGAFKTVSTKHINQLRGTPGATFWQRNYYEHVIRNEADLKRIREYIVLNPARWNNDLYNPNATGPNPRTS